MALQLIGGDESEDPDSALLPRRALSAFALDLYSRLRQTARLSLPTSSSPPWLCSTCTLRNIGARSICEVCSTPRRLGDGIAPSSTASAVVDAVDLTAEPLESPSLPTPVVKQEPKAADEVCGPLAWPLPWLEEKAASSAEEHEEGTAEADGPVEHVAVAGDEELKEGPADVQMELTEAEEEEVEREDEEVTTEAAEVSEVPDVPQAVGVEAAVAAAEPPLVNEEESAAAEMEVEHLPPVSPSPPSPSPFNLPTVLPSPLSSQQASGERHLQGGEPVEPEAEDGMRESSGNADGRPQAASFSGLSSPSPASPSPASSSPAAEPHFPSAAVPSDGLASAVPSPAVSSSPVSPSAISPSELPSSTVATPPDSSSTALASAAPSSACSPPASPSSASTSPSPVELRCEDQLRLPAVEPSTSVAALLPSASISTSSSSSTALVSLADGSEVETPHHLQCSICFGLFTRPVSLPCSHTFCAACILKHAQEFKVILENRVKEGRVSFGLTDAEMAALEEDPSVAISFDARCSVCCGPEMDNDDLVICGRCGVHVHQHCYGVKDIPDGEWLCEPCSLTGPSTAYPPSCVLCTNDEDRAFKQTGGPTPDGTLSVFHPTLVTARTRFVHVACALHHAEVQFSEGDNEWRSPVVDLTLVHKDRFDLLKCMFCQQSEVGRTACLQCCYGRCQKAYCVPCGMRRGVRFETRVRLDDDGEEMQPQHFSFCPTHRKYSEQVTERNSLPKKKLQRLVRKSIRFPCPHCRGRSVLLPTRRNLQLSRRYDLSLAVRLFRFEHQLPCLPSQEEESDEEPQEPDSPKKPKKLPVQPEVKSAPAEPFDTIAKTKTRRSTAGTNHRNSTSPPRSSSPSPAIPVARASSDLLSRFLSSSPVRPVREEKEVRMTDVSDRRSGSGAVVEMTVAEMSACLAERRAALQDAEYQRMLKSLVVEPWQWPEKRFTSALFLHQLETLLQLHGYKVRPGFPRAGDKSALKKEIAAVLMRWIKDGKIRMAAELLLTLPRVECEEKSQPRQPPPAAVSSPPPSPAPSKVVVVETKGVKPKKRKKKRKEVPLQLQKSKKKKKAKTQAQQQPPPAQPVHSGAEEKMEDDSKEAFEADLEQDEESKVADVDEEEEQKEVVLPVKPTATARPPSRPTAPAPSPPSTAPLPLLPRIPIPVSSDDEEMNGDDLHPPQPLSHSQRSSASTASPTASPLRPSPETRPPPSPLPFMAPSAPVVRAPSAVRRFVQQSDAAISSFSAQLAQLVSRHGDVMLQRSVNAGRVGAEDVRTGPVLIQRLREECEALHQQLYVVEQAMMVEAIGPIKAEPDVILIMQGAASGGNVGSAGSGAGDGGGVREQRAKVSVKAEPR